MMHMGILAKPGLWSVAVLSLMLSFCGEAKAQMSSVLISGVPLTAKVNQDVVLSARLAEMFDGTPLAGVPVKISVGDKYSVSTTQFYTSNSGVVQRTWRFYSPGIYRVSFKFEGGWGYMDDRLTVLIQVNK